jgi:hypothetical protein
MPIPYVKKLAKKHGTSIRESEGKWGEAKKAAEKQGKGDNYGYVTQIYKSMMHEKSRTEEALVKGWGKYQKMLLKVKLHVATKAGREIDLTKGDKIGLRLSSNGKLTRMITEKYGPTIVVTLTHEQAEKIRRKCSTQ